MKYAILTPVGPGRDWLLDRIWPEALEAAGCPKSETRVCVLNNSGNPRLTRRAAETLQGQGWAEWRVAANRETGSAINKRMKGLSSHMAECYARLMRMAGDAEYSLTLETDISLPSREELLGVWPVDRLMGGMEKDVAMVGTPVCSRHQREKKVSVYRMDSVAKWPRSKSSVPVQDDGRTSVHAHGHCFVLMRTKPVRDAGFTATPNLNGTGGLGHEWGNQKRLLLDGWRIMVDWRVRPAHWKSPKEWVKA